jgi:ectoine hydroxylase-related dioxygenase (phytanoyl-CoA dioxygenase family)
MSSEYYCTIDTVKATLAEYGVAIVPNVLSDEECDEMLSGLWDYFEHITSTWDTPINRNDKTTWSQIYNLYLLHSMLIQYWNIGHCQAAWDIRQNEKCADVFANLWGCKKDDLLVSFDGASFNLPPEVTRRGWNRNNTWYHTDQSFTRPDFECVQSWVTALDVNEGDATLSIFEKSHLLHKEVAEHFNITDKKDWLKLTKEQEAFYFEHGCTIKNITCPKGSLVLWDSRTIHCGIEAVKTRATPNLRAVIYLCYMPRKQSNSKKLAKKQKAFNELRMTTHYPCNPKLFPNMPRTYGNAIPQITRIDAPILTDFGKRLAGF